MNLEIQQKEIMNFVKTIKNINDEIILNFTDKGIHTTTTDPAHIQMITLTLKKETFKQYDIKNLKTTKIGINLEKIYQFLRIYKKDDIIKITYDENNFKLIMQKGYLIRTFGTIDIDNIFEPKKPEIKLNKNIRINTTLLLNNIKQITPGKKKDRKNLMFTTTKQGLQLKHIDFEENPSITIPTKDITYITTNDNRPTVYECEYILQQLIQTKNLVKEITIEYSFEHPMRITCENKTYKIEYLVAPKIDEKFYEYVDTIEANIEETMKEKLEKIEKENIEPEIETEQTNTTQEKQQYVIAIIQTGKNKYLYGKIISEKEKTFEILFKKQEKPIEIKKEIITKYK
jgi:proliferating cell nuclear antigen